MCRCCRAVGRTLEEFKTSVNVAAHQKVTFELTYEELLKRKHGKYEVQIHAQPMQPVKDFKVSVGRCAEKHQTEAGGLFTGQMLALSFTGGRLYQGERRH